MIKKLYIGLIIVFLVVMVAFIFTVYNEGNTGVKHVLLASTDLGNVSYEGPYGNVNSKVKIAFVVGVHPLEFNAHNSLLRNIRAMDKNLSYCYYVYIINVTKDRNNFDKGRLNGQILGRDYALPHILANNYTLVVDVHSNRGVYASRNFLVVPLNENKSYKIAKNISDQIKGLDILNFTPEDNINPSSPQYITIPILKKNIPSFIFEAYMYQKDDVTDRLMRLFINCIDNYKFNT